MTGWGHKEFKEYGEVGRNSDTLQEVEVPIKEYPKDVDEIHAGEGEGKGVAGESDSGGPLMCKRSSEWVVEGTVNFGFREYTAFTKVAKNLKWIEKYLK